MRKEAFVTIDAEGRDKGKMFYILEMPAAKAEKWAARAFLALAGSNVDVGDVAESGIAGIAAVGIKALASLRFEAAEPLMDEMFECIQMVPEPSKPERRRRLIDDDIEEVATRIKLRMEVFELHVGFSMGASPSTSPSPSPSLIPAKL